MVVEVTDVVVVVNEVDEGVVVDNVDDVEVVVGGPPGPPGWNTTSTQ